MPVSASQDPWAGALALEREDEWATCFFFFFFKLYLDLLHTGFFCLTMGRKYKETTNSGSEGLVSQYWCDGAGGCPDGEK